MALRSKKWYDMMKRNSAMHCDEVRSISASPATFEVAATPIFTQRIKNFLIKEEKKMNIEFRTENEKTIVDMEGRLDTNTSPGFQKELESYFNQEGFDLVLDFDKLDFVSSAGLRVLLLIQKKGKALNGNMVIRHVKPEIQEVFNMTGFSEILTIE
jgi:anti-anti-sigma factor